MQFYGRWYTRIIWLTFTEVLELLLISCLLITIYYYLLVYINNVY